jgi:hypothetical protein
MNSHRELIIHHLEVWRDSYPISGIEGFEDVRIAVRWSV